MIVDDKKKWKCIKVPKDFYDIVSIVSKKKKKKKKELFEDLKSYLINHL